MNFTVLESFDIKYCCVCTQNSVIYFDIFKSVISFKSGEHSSCISIAAILNEILDLKIENESCNAEIQKICSCCKDQVINFFVFKRRNEEARRNFQSITSTSLPPTKISKVERSLINDDTTNVTTSRIITEPAIISGDDESVSSKIEALEEEEEFLMEDDTMVNDEETTSLETCDIKSKDASNISTKRRRKGSLNPKLWVRNRRKLAKNAGQSYVASNGKCVEAKEMRPNCGEQCRMKCSRKLTEIERRKLFQNFYALADIEKQRKYLFDLIRSYEPKKLKLSLQKSRSIQRKYFLRPLNSSLEAPVEEIQVCRLMFLNTFAVSSQTIDTIFKKSQSENKFRDIRGKFKRKFQNSSASDDKIEDE